MTILASPHFLLLLVWGMLPCQTFHSLSSKIVSLFRLQAHPFANFCWNFGKPRLSSVRLPFNAIRRRKANFETRPATPIFRTIGLNVPPISSEHHVEVEFARHQGAETGRHETCAMSIHELSEVPSWTHLQGVLKLSLQRPFHRADGRKFLTDAVAKSVDLQGGQLVAASDWLAAGSMT